MDSGDYYWNGGIFLFRASRYLEKLSKYRSDIFEICQSSKNDMEPDLEFIRVDRDIFTDCPSDSVDYAVIEKAADAATVPMDAG